MKLSGRSFVWGFVAAAYVGGLIAYVVGWILPDVRILKEETRAVLEFRADADRRVDDLGTMLRTLREVTTDRPEEMPLPADSAQQIRSAILPYFSAVELNPESGDGAMRYAEVGIDASVYEVRVAEAADAPWRKRPRVCGSRAPVARDAHGHLAQRDASVASDTTPPSAV